MASRTRGDGFTLLEVLVAVALLGLVVSVLAQSAIQGLGYEGDASRRLRASLLADTKLWGVEAELKLGAPPKPRQESEEIEEFEVTLEVEPLDPAQAGLAALLSPTPTGERPEAPLATGPDAPPVPLFQILVRVRWVEGLHEREVTRSSFAYDGTVAAQLLGAEQETQQPAPVEEQTPPPEEPVE